MFLSYFVVCRMVNMEKRFSNYIYIKQIDYRWIRKVGKTVVQKNALMKISLKMKRQLNVQECGQRRHIKEGIPSDQRLENFMT